MAFKMSTQKVTGTVNVVEIGTGDKAIKLGGEQVLPFYSFDGETGNAPVVGAESRRPCYTFVEVRQTVYDRVYPWLNHI